MPVESKMTCLFLQRLHLPGIDALDIVVFISENRGRGRREKEEGEEDEEVGSSSHGHQMHSLLYSQNLGL